MVKAGINPLKAGDYTSLGFKAAQFTRETGQKIGPMNSGADAHTIPDLDTLRTQAQAFWRDNGIYKGIVTRLIDNTLGTGSVLMAKTASDAVNSKLESLWKAFWHGKPEVRGMFNGPKVERLALTSFINAGDFGTIKTSTGQVQLVESELIYTPALFNDATNNKIVQGIELNDYGAPVAYYRCQFSRFGWRKLDPKRIDAKDFLFIANIERPSQTRGIPLLTATFPMLHRFNDICDSEAVAWQLLSKLAIAVTKKDAEQIAAGISEADPCRPSDGPQDVSYNVQDFEWGTIFQGSPGSAVNGIDRNIPGPNFTASATMFLRLLGQGVGMPLELILLDWSKTNYSSARAALEQFFVMILGLQANIRFYISDIYAWKVQEWIDAGKIVESNDIFEHDWILPQSPWVDQLKESQAQGEQLDRALTTHGEALKSLNRTREDFVAQRSREVVNAIETAKAINDKYPDANVPWELFAGLKAPGTMAAVAAMESDAPEKDTPDPKDTQTPDEKDPQPADAKDVKGVK